MTVSRRKWLGGVAAIAVLVALITASAAISHPAYPPRSLASPPTQTSAVAGQFFDYVVIILMENHNFCDVFTHCGGTGPYETNLGDNFSVPKSDYYCHTNPSLPNYLCLTGGTTFGCTTDDSPNSTACTQAAWTAPNIVDRLVAGGVTWKAYMENMTSNCLGSNAYPYAVRHDPFVYYSDIATNSSRCNRVIPAGTNDATFLGDLGSTSTASNYMWLTPNVRNDAHDTDVAYADAYLANLVPQILASPVFTTQRAALFITYDEGYGPPTFAEWAGPAVKNNYTSTVAYDHFSVLKTVEDNWGLPSLTTNDGTASNMSEFFKPPAPDFSISANPASVYFPPGLSNTSNISVHATGGFTGNVGLSASSSPSGVTTTCVPSSITPGVVSECTFSATNTGNYLVNVTGTNGTLVHTVSIRVAVSNTPPPTTKAVLLGTHGANGWYVSNVAVTLSAINLGTGGAIYYHLDTAAWREYSGSFVVGEGSHTLYYNGTNGDGVPEATNTVAIDVDTTPPFVTSSLIGTVGANGWYVSGVRITLNPIDNASGVASVSYRIDTGSVVVYSIPFDVTDGIHSVVYFATDVAGLRSANGSLRLMVDTLPPAFHNLSPSGVVTQSAVTVSWNATDASGIRQYQVRVDNGSYQNVGLSTSLQLNLTDGPHTVQVIATDTAGLNNAAVIQFQVNSGGLSPSMWDLIIPLFAVVALLAAFAIAWIVLRRRRRQKGGAEGLR